MKRLFVSLLLFVVLNSIFSLKPVREYPFRPENFGMIYKELKAITSDDYQINIWFFPAQEVEEPFWKYFQEPIKREYETLSDKPKPTIIICPGDAGNMAHLVQFAYYLAPKGYNVVTFDWRGFGESDDFPIKENYFCHTEFFKDYDAVLDTIKQFDEVDSDKIGIYGFSTSAYLTMATIYRRQDINCFIARGLLTDLKTLQAYYLEEHNEFVEIPSDYPSELYPKNIANKFDIPTLLIVGEFDKITPVWMSENIYSQLIGEKELWIVEHTGHAPEWDEEIGLDNYIERMAEFFDKYLKQ